MNHQDIYAGQDVTITLAEGAKWKEDYEANHSKVRTVQRAFQDMEKNCSCDLAFYDQLAKLVREQGLHYPTVVICATIQQNRKEYIGIPYSGHEDMFSFQDRKPWIVDCDPERIKKAFSALIAAQYLNLSDAYCTEAISSVAKALDEREGGSEVIRRQNDRKLDLWVDDLVKNYGYGNVKAVVVETLLERKYDERIPTAVIDWSEAHGGYTTPPDLPIHRNHCSGTILANLGTLLYFRETDFGKTIGDPGFLERNWRYEKVYPNEPGYQYPYREVVGLPGHFDRWKHVYLESCA